MTAPGTADRPGTPDGPAPQAAGQAASVAFRRTAFAEADDTSAVLAWDELPQNCRDGWEAAAQAAIEASPELRGHTAEIERLRGLLDAAAAPAPAAEDGSLRADLEETLASWRDSATYRPTDTRDEMSENYGVSQCADTLAGILADHPDTGAQPAPGLPSRLKAILLDVTVPPVEARIQALRLLDEPQPQPALDLARAETAGVLAAAANTARDLAALADALDAEGREEITIARKHQGQRHETGMQRGRVFELCASRIRRVAGLEGK